MPTIDGFFSLFKKGTRGVYHSVSVKWFQGYLNEYTCRYNPRDKRGSMFLDLLSASRVEFANGDVGHHAPTTPGCTQTLRSQRATKGESQSC
jgi:hypothetical protein